MSRVLRSRIPIGQCNATRLYPKESYDRPANCGLSRYNIQVVLVVLGKTHPLKMTSTKSGSPNVSRLDQNNIAKRNDPLSKWVTRAIYLLITLATFSWLDTIKVGNLFHLFTLSQAVNPVLSPRIDGTYSTQSISTSCSSPHSPHRPTTPQA